VVAGVMPRQLEAHPRITGVGAPEKLVLSHVALPWGEEDLMVILPVDPFTADDWLRRFRDAGVRIAGAEREHPSRMTTTSPGAKRASVPSSLRRSAAAAAGTSPGWRMDPTGRHEYRYFATGWTRHVSDNGKPSTDAL
jgi:hypothetical protein